MREREKERHEECRGRRWEGGSGRKISKGPIADGPGADEVLLRGALHTEATPCQICFRVRNLSLKGEATKLVFNASN